MNAKRRALRLLCCLLLLLSLCLCSCGETDPEAGEYLCADLTVDGVPLEPADCRLLLSDGGTGVLSLNGMDGTVLWSREGEKLSLDLNGRVLTGRIADGVVILTDGGTVLTLTRPELAEGYRAARTREREEEALRASVWLGDWYGWWRISSSAGELEDTWYDLFAVVRPQADGTLLLTLWDEDQAASGPMAELTLYVDGEGLARTAEGYFWFEDAPELTLRLEDGLLSCEGRHDGGGESFDFLLHLRRWGDRWDGDPDKPYYYADWYLPLIEAGEPMPGEMSGVK